MVCIVTVRKQVADEPAVAPQGKKRGRPGAKQCRAAAKLEQSVGSLKATKTDTAQQASGAITRDQDLEWHDSDDGDDHHGGQVEDESDDNTGGWRDA